MSRHFWHHGWLCAVAAVLAWPAAVPAQEIVASNGASLPVPDIRTLECDELLDLMHRYSASRYRVPGTIPQSEADKRLFAYEHVLAETHFVKCHLGRSDFSIPSRTFGQGFN